VTLLPERSPTTDLLVPLLAGQLPSKVPSK
jgi:hypothetical protein